MTEVKTSPIVATRVDDITRSTHIPGAFKFFNSGGNGPSGMNFICPCGCGALSPLHFERDETADPAWQWDGNIEKPTLTPSVHWVGHWHGYLRGGVWESCAGVADFTFASDWSGNTRAVLGANVKGIEGGQWVAE